MKDEEKKGEETMLLMLRVNTKRKQSERKNLKKCNEEKENEKERLD